MKNPTLPLLLIALFVGTAAPQGARRGSPDDPEAKRALVARNMAIKQGHPFWTLYLRYQKELDKIHARTRKMIKLFAKNHAIFTDQEAKALLDEFVSIEADSAKLKKDWVAKFLAVMPPVKVARYYQLENKFSAMFRYQLAQKIPLAR